MTSNRKCESHVKLELVEIGISEIRVLAPSSQEENPRRKIVRLIPNMKGPYLVGKLDIARYASRFQSISWNKRITRSFFQKQMERDEKDSTSIIE